MTEKRCSRCGQNFPETAEYFQYFDKKRGILRPECKVCSSVDGRKRYAENQEIYLGRAAEYRRRNNEVIRERDRYRRDRDRGKRAVWNRRWRQHNRERKNELGRLWRANNPQAARSSTRRYRQRHSEKERARNQRRKAERRAVEGQYTAEDLHELWRLQEGQCAYCGNDLNGEYHVDHVHPISRGGTNWPENLVLACPKCNETKHDKLVDEWWDRWYWRDDLKWLI